jgi:Lrp/AsnC family transcriptional regulator, leucine-responsive regulatory protein
MSLGKSSVAKIELDKTDGRLLRELQRDNQLTNLQLAERVHLSPPTCMRRVRRLRDAMVIVADVSLIDPEKIGQSLSAFVEITLERQNDQLQRVFELKMQKSPQVVQCYKVSGPADYMIMVQVTDMNAYESFLRTVLNSDANIKTARSIFTLHRSKYWTGVNLDEI